MCRSPAVPIPSFGCASDSNGNPRSSRVSAVQLSIRTFLHEDIHMRLRKTSFNILSYQKASNEASYVVRSMLASLMTGGASGGLWPPG